MPFGSVLAEKAKNVLTLEYEAFIDRKYNDDLSLVSRSEKGAVIYNPEAAWRQLQLMIEKQIVETKQNTNKSIIASTFCIHSDTSTVVETLSYLRLKLKELDIGLYK